MKKRKQKRNDEELGVLVIDTDDGPVAFTVPAELVPEARVPGFNFVPEPSEKADD
jgi:hypothetical protein